MLVITPKQKDLGDNFIVRRALPHIEKRMVGPFVFWDHMGPAKITNENKMKVRAHPHIGLSTITYLFSGEVMHRDSLDNEQVIRPGEVNWMTAGKGIVHSERTPEPVEEHTIEGIQLWLALPKEHEKISPSFVHHKEKDLPLIEKGGLKLRLIAGNFLEQKSPLPVYSDLFYLQGKLVKGADFQIPVTKDQESAIYIVSGKAQVNGENLERFQLACFEKGQMSKITAQEDLEFMILGGEPFPEGRTVWWNFVASNKELIEEAKANWKKNSFGDVINETEFIPLPEN